MRATSLVAVLVATAALAPSPALAQVSDPIAHDGVVTDRDGGNNKFLDRKALPDSHDDEEALRRAWRFEPDDLVTNRPLWASALLRRWRAAELRACGAVTQPSTPTATPTP